MLTLAETLYNTPISKKLIKTHIESICAVEIAIGYTLPRRGKMPLWFAEAVAWCEQWYEHNGAAAGHIVTVGDCSRAWLEYRKTAKR